MSKPIFITDIFETIVAATSKKVLPQIKAFDPNITGVNYQFGHPTEITQTLDEWSSGTKDADKYPLIALLLDTPMDKGYINVEAKLDLHFIIARRTEQNYKAAERLKQNFKPVLYPVYDEFMRQLYFSGCFSDAMDPKHRQIDRYFWGKQGLYGNEKNVFNDKIDAIEIQNLKLTLYKQNC
jgi:hypothetical protein